MEIKQLQSFAAVVQYQSFTKAAEKLYLSQPTVSAHIRALEAELGQQLILRTTKTVEVTPKGREIYDHVVNLLDLRQRIVDACGQQQRSILHLGASTIPSSYILPHILPAFARQYPDIYFVIHQSNSQDVLNGVRDGRFDIGLVGMYQEGTEVVCTPFCRDRIVLISPVTPQFLALQQQPQTPLRELLAGPVILREKGSGSKKSATDYLESIGILESDLHVTARINDQEAIKNLVAGGVGVSLISERAARNFVKERRLLQFELPHSKGRTFYLVTRQGTVPEPHTREFACFVQAYFAHRPAEL